MHRVPRPRLAIAIARTCSVVALVTTALSAGAAHAESHVLDLRLGLGSASARDDTLVPLAFTGPGLIFAPHYELTVGRHSALAEIDLGMAYMETRFDQLAVQISHGFSAGYAYAIEPGASRWRIGAVLREETEMSYLASWDDAHGYWLATLALSPLLQYSRPLWFGAQLEARAELALFGLAARPPLERRNKQDALTHVSFHFDRLFHRTRWFSPLDVQWLRLEALARLRDVRAHAGAGFGFGLSASFARANDPRPYALLRAGVVIAYGFSL